MEKFASTIRSLVLLFLSAAIFRGAMLPGSVTMGGVAGAIAIGGVIGLFALVLKKDLRRRSIAAPFASTALGAVMLLCLSVVAVVVFRAFY